MGESMNASLVDLSERVDVLVNELLRLEGLSVEQRIQVIRDYYVIADALERIRRTGA